MMDNAYYHAQVNGSVVERQFLSLVPKTIRDVKLVPAGTYELAGRCPIAVMSLPE